MSINSLLPTTPLNTEEGLVNQSTGEHATSCVPTTDEMLNLTTTEIEHFQREKLLKDSTMEEQNSSWLSEYTAAPTAMTSSVLNRKTEKPSDHSKHFRRYTHGDVYQFTDQSSEKTDANSSNSIESPRQLSPNQSPLISTSYNSPLLSTGVLQAKKRNKRKLSSGDELAEKRKRGAPAFPAINETNELEQLLKRIGGLSWFPKSGQREGTSSLSDSPTSTASIEEVFSGLSEYKLCVYSCHYSLYYYA